MENIYIAEWLYLILWIIYIVTVIGIILIVLSENRNPLKSMSWIMVLVFFPVGGLILYLFLGRDFRKQRMISKKSFKKIEQYTVDNNINPETLNTTSDASSLVHLLKNIANSKLYPSNSVQIFTDGSSMIDELIGYKGVGFVKSEKQVITNAKTSDFVVTQQDREFHK